MKILVLDNYDSFTWNLVHAIEKFIPGHLDVFRNDCITLHEISRYDKIVLSPGPGLPNDAGILKPLIEEFAATKSILGVCLGMQAIAEVFGGKLENLNRVYHGVATPMHILKADEPIFAGIPDGFEAGRYHSWVVSKNGLPSCLSVTCEDETGQIMALTHIKYDIKGVQFHPESVMTPCGDQIISNWLSS